MNRKKLIIIALIVVGVFVIGLIEYFLFLNKNLKGDLATRSATPTQTALKSAVATLTRDSTKTPTPRTPTPTPSIPDEQLIGEALGTEMGTDVSNLDVTISKKSESAAYGSVNIKGEMSGGWFVAVEEDGKWQIIADGNGTIDCAILDEHNVPNTVVGECYDSVADASKTR